MKPIMAPKDKPRMNPAWLSQAWLFGPTLFNLASLIRFKLGAINS
jgi:hypothetical protein